MKRYTTALLLVCSVFVWLVSGCKKDENKHPEVQTLGIETLSPTKIILKGNIVSTGGFNSTDYGFYYGTSQSLGDGMGTKISVGNDPKEGQFSKEIQNLPFYSGSQTLYARAYVTDRNGTVYGPVISVQIPAVSYSSIVPSNGRAGDLVTINGQFHKLTKEEVSVTFGGIPGSVEDITSSKITVKVPAGVTTSYNGSNQVTVFVAVGGQGLYGSQNAFTINPTPKDFSPKSGPMGTMVVITGDNMPSSYYYSNLKVFFGQVQGSISSQSSSGVSVVIPANITEQKCSVSIEFNGIKTTLPGEFTLTPHTVTAISPTTGLPGSSFSVFGSNFTGSYYSSGNLSATVGGIPASVSYISSGQLTVTIPNNLPAGDYKVAIKSGPFTIEATQLLKVQALTATSFSPASGGVGKEITIQGVFMAGQSHQVYFGSSTSAYSHSATSTALKVYVPFGAPPGDTKLTVKYGNQTAETSSEFTVLAPSITSFSPASGVAGTLVTISGSGFNSYAGNNTVKFGTIQTNVISASESTLVVAVPSNLNLGAMKITVISNGQTIVSSANFTATN